MLSWDAYESGLERLLDLLEQEEGALPEFESSKSEFYASPEDTRVPGCERRHLEWFLLERPCQALGGVPAVVLRESWLAELPGAGTELATASMQSMPGAFEVTALVAGEGVWVRDLFSLGEHPVVEPHATLTIEVGDLLVGRLFPAGGGSFLLSPAVSVFRNSTLLEAVRVDLGSMRAARRGVLRVQQLELERLFHGPEMALPLQPTLEEARQQARAALLEIGLSVDVVDGILQDLARAGEDGDGTVLSEILNRLAFDTAMDLAAVRLVLTALWESERPRPAAAGVEVDPVRHGTAADACASGMGPGDALGAFDRGRAQGKDLEALFQELERDLGVADEDGGDDEGEAPGAPDFPGVVGAMLEEFLWEVEREEGAPRAQAWQGLRLLGAYTRDIGVFEELSAARLLDFSARWMLDEGGIQEASEIASLLQALAAFCRWCEQKQGLALWTDFGKRLEELAAPIERHWALRRTLSAGAGEGLRDGLHTVVRIGERSAWVRGSDGDEGEVVLEAAQREHLREEDLVRLVRLGSGPRLGATYPAALAELSV